MSEDGNLTSVQFLVGVIKSLEITVAEQRATIARLEGERDTWRAKGEYK